MRFSVDKYILQKWKKVIDIYMRICYIYVVEYHARRGNPPKKMVRKNLTNKIEYFII